MSVNVIESIKGDGQILRRMTSETCPTEQTMIGQTISHYKILDKLGEGGMGVVYKAEDLMLKRLVALKFLPHHLTASPEEQARFMQEAQSAATLNHPNVCTIHAIEEADVPASAGAPAGRQQFIAMEFVDGTTLREKIAAVEASGRTSLPVNDAITYAIQIGEALQEAHSKGIIHRDVKAENVMVNAKNQIKVMDFGLAKLKGSLKLTRTSSTVGTLAYMSPEQIQGGEADTRSDIFSFGVVLYEMLTGRLPFRGEHEAAMMYSIVNEEPDPVQKYRPELPGDFTHILAKALDKDPDDRYQSVTDMVVDLRRLKKQSTRVLRTSTDMKIAGVKPVAEASIAGEPVSIKTSWLKKRAVLVSLAVGAIAVVVVASLLLFRGRTPATTEPAADRKMLVVLPFENLGPADQEYFVDGLTEEITSRLSGLSGLGVIARSSATQYKKTTKSIKEIGGELGVSYILQGTVRWETADGAAHLRVTPQLIKVSDGTQVWSQPTEAVLSSAFKIQSDIASQVAGALGVSLLQPERKALEGTPTDNSEAYDAYLRGNDYFRRSYGEQDFRIAQQMYEKAVTLDPKFALAWAKLSETHSAMYWFYYDHTKQRLSEAKSAVDEALKLDPGLPDAHASLGYYYYWGFLDYDNALKELAIAQRSRPNDTRLLLGIGAVQRRQGKMELAAATMTKAAELDPRSAELARNTSQTYRLLRDFPTAERFIDRTISLAPDLTSSYFEKAWLYLIWKGDTKKAREVLQQAQGVGGVENDPSIFQVQVSIEMIDGNYKEALRRIDAGPAKPYDDQFWFIPRTQLYAEVYGLMKERKLERAYYDSARVLLEKKILEQPEDARYHSALGIAYAGLGRREDAIREGKRGVELLPTSKEAWRGTYRLRDLARIYSMVGESAAALDQLELLLSIPSDVSAALLRIDPTWTSLRNNSRFQKLIAENK